MDDLNISVRQCGQDDVIQAVRRWGRCAIFLGAGASVAAGIPSARGVIVELGRKLLGDEQLTPEQVVAGLKLQPFYDHEHAYASVLDAAFPSEAERVLYFEALISDKFSTSTHKAVASLISYGYASVVVTTNFDRLIEHAVVEVCQHIPCVLPSDQVSDYLTLASPRAKALKLHGDYLYGNIRNLDHELYQVKASMFQKLELAAAEPVMIVAGYSGGDSSVMEVFKALAGKPSSFCGGVYWLHLPGYLPESKELKSVLLAMENRGSGFVEIVDSDSFFAKLLSSLAPKGVYQLPPLPENPQQSLIGGGLERARQFVSDRLGPIEASEFFALIERRSDLASFVWSAAGLDYLLARYEEQGELPGNVGELMDRYVDLLAGASTVKQGKYDRRVEQMRRLSLVAENGKEQRRTEFGLLRHYVAALKMAETDELDFEKVGKMLADDEGYETLRSYVGLAWIPTLAD